MSQTQYYDVVEQTKYFIEIDRIEAPEDAGEEFITSDELSELTGGNGWGSTRYFAPAIKTAMSEVLASIKPGKKSAIITDEELLEALKKTHHPASAYVDGVRRVGNRLFKAGQSTKKEQAAPMYSNWRRLVNCADRYVWNQHSVDITFNMQNCNRVGAVDFLKTFIADIDVFITTTNYAEDEDETKWWKIMWEDSTTIPLVKRSN